VQPDARGRRFHLAVGAIQSDAALRQSTEGRQMAAATLSVGVLLAILEVAPEIRVPFRVDSHHSSKLGGKSQGGRRDRNQPYRESPQRECITLDRTLWQSTIRHWLLYWIGIEFPAACRLRGSTGS
jgi:hypothetical protein